METWDGSSGVEDARKGCRSAFMPPETVERVVDVPWCSDRTWIEPEIVLMKVLRSQWDFWSACWPILNVRMLIEPDVEVMVRWEVERGGLLLLLLLWSPPSPLLFLEVEEEEEGGGGGLKRRTMSILPEMVLSVRPSSRRKLPLMDSWVRSTRDPF